MSKHKTAAEIRAGKKVAEKRKEYEDAKTFLQTLHLSSEKRRFVREMLAESETRVEKVLEVTNLQRDTPFWDIMYGDGYNSIQTLLHDAVLTKNRWYAVAAWFQEHEQRANECVRRYEAAAEKANRRAGKAHKVLRRRTT